MRVSEPVGTLRNDCLTLADVRQAPGVCRTPSQNTASDLARLLPVASCQRDNMRSVLGSGSQTYNALQFLRPNIVCFPQLIEVLVLIVDAS